MIVLGLMAWLNFSLFLILFALFIYIIARNVITLLHKTYLLFHFFMMLWPLGQFAAGMADYPPIQLMYRTLSYTGLALIGCGWLIFTLALTGRIQRLRSLTLLLSASPALIAAAGIALNPDRMFIDWGDSRNGHFNWRIM